MLLFVMTSELNQVSHRGLQTIERAENRRVNIGAVFQNLLQRGTRDSPTRAPCYPCAFGFVVAVEEYRKSVH